VKKLKRKIRITVERTDTGYSAYSDELAVYTTGKNAESLTENLIEALNLFFEDQGFYIDHSNLKLMMDIPQLFRHYRVLNQKFVARRIKMSPSLLSEYVSGSKKPSSKQTMRIAKGIHTIGQELAGLDLIE